MDTERRQHCQALARSGRGRSALPHAYLLDSMSSSGSLAEVCGIPTEGEPREPEFKGRVRSMFCSSAFAAVVANLHDPEVLLFEPAEAHRAKLGEPQAFANLLEAKDFVAQEV